MPSPCCFATASCPTGSDSGTRGAIRARRRSAPGSMVTAVASTYLEQWLASHPLSWINVGNIGNGIAFVWIIALLLAWRRPATTQARAQGVPL